MTQRFHYSSSFFSERILYVLLFKTEMLISPVLFYISVRKSKRKLNLACWVQLHSNTAYKTFKKWKVYWAHISDGFQDNSLAVIIICHARHKLLEIICYSLHSYYLPGTSQTEFMKTDVFWTFLSKETTDAGQIKFWWNKGSRFELLTDT